MGDESGDRGEGGWGGGFGGETPGGGSRGYGKADISSLGLPDDPFGSWGSSFGPNQYGKMDPAAQELFDRLRAQYIEDLTLSQYGARFGRGFLGLNPGPYGLSQWGHPAGQAVAAGAYGLGLVGGPLGGLAGRLARGAAEIATGSNKDFGGGFGTALGDRGIGPATDPANTSRGGQTVSLPLMYAQDQSIMSDATPIGGGLPVPQFTGREAFQPQGQVGWSPGGPDPTMPTGLPVAETPQPGLPVPATQPPAQTPGAPDPYAGLPPAIAQQLRMSDALRAKALEQLQTPERQPNKILQGLALGVAGAGDVARNLMVNPQTGVPLYAPSSTFMDNTLAAQTKTNAAADGKNGKSKQQAVLDATDKDREHLLKVAEFAGKSTDQTLKLQKEFLDRAKALREEAADAGTEQQASVGQAIVKMRKDMGLPDYYDVFASTKPKDVTFTQALGALSSYLPAGSSQEQLSAFGIDIAQYRKNPDAELKSLQGRLGVYALNDALQRTRAAVGVLRKSGQFGDGPIPTDAVKDLVVGMAGDKADAMRLAFEGALFPSKEIGESFNNALGQLGVERIGEKAKVAEKKAADVAETATLVARQEALRPGDVAKAVETEEKLRPGKVQTAADVKRAEKEIEAQFKDKDPNNATHVAGLRKEYVARAGPFEQVRDAWRRVQVAEASPAGDVALIYGFMRMQDPGSTVREGEFATAQNAAGVSDRVRNIYNKLVSGERLTVEQREDFKSQASKQFNAALGGQRRLEQEYTRLAKASGFDPAQVIVDLIQEFRVDPRAEEEKRRRDQLLQQGRSRVDRR